MITLLIYFGFSYLFMGAYAWDIFSIEDNPILIAMIFIVWFFSPVLMPIMLGQMLADNEIK